MFARKPSPDLARLVKAVQTQTTQSQDKAAAFVVFLPDNADTATSEIEKFAADNKITMPLTIPEKMDDVQSKFGITPSDAMATQVLVYSKKKVQKPFALTQIKDTDVQAVQAAIKKSIA